MPWYVLLLHRRVHGTAAASWLLDVFWGAGVNTDIRISTSFLNHRKRKKLTLQLGPGATGYLVDLWLNTAINRPKGRLSGMSAEDIALDAGWENSPDVFVKALLDAGFLDFDGEEYSVHDWAIHQSYAVHAEARSERSKKAAEAKWGATGSKERDADNKATRAERMREARAKGNHTDSQWFELRDYFGTCVKCGGESMLSTVDRDHIIPVYRGGCHSLCNIQPLCAKCNAGKGPDSFDYRVTFCQRNSLSMPTEWLRESCVNYACSVRDACLTHAQTSAPFPAPSPVPSPIPSPIPIPIPNPKEEKPLGDKPPVIVPQKRKEDNSGLVDQIFSYWQEVHSHPRARLDAKRRKLVIDRMKDGYTAMDIKEAIDGCKLSPHHQGQNETKTMYDDLELICRDGKHMDMFIKLAGGQIPNHKKQTTADDLRREYGIIQ